MAGEVEGEEGGEGAVVVVIVGGIGVVVVLVDALLDPQVASDPFSRMRGEGVLFVMVSLPSRPMLRSIISSSS